MSTTQENTQAQLAPMKIKRKYKCKLCNSITLNPRRHLRHLVDAHDQKIKCVECPFCEYACQYRQKLNRHLRLVHKMTPIEAKSIANGATGFTNNASSASTMQQVDYQNQIELHGRQSSAHSLAINQENQLQHHPHNIYQPCHQSLDNTFNPIWNYQQYYQQQHSYYNQFNPFNHFNQDQAQMPFYQHNNFYYHQQYQQERNNQQQYYQLQQQQHAQQTLQYLIQTLIVGSSVGRNRCLAAPSVFMAPSPGVDVSPIGPNEPVDLTLASNGRVNSKETT